MDKYCEKTGKVDLLHWTNGVRVTFNDGMSLWYEPESLEKLTDRGCVHPTEFTRLLPNKRV